MKETVWKRKLWVFSQNFISRSHHHTLFVPIFEESIDSSHSSLIQPFMNEWAAWIAAFDWLPQWSKRWSLKDDEWASTPGRVGVSGECLDPTPRTNQSIRFCGLSLLIFDAFDTIWCMEYIRIDIEITIAMITECVCVCWVDLELPGTPPWFHSERSFGEGEKSLNLSFFIISFLWWQPQPVIFFLIANLSLI